MPAKRTGFHRSQIVAFPLRAPSRSIGDAELALVQDAMADISPDWSVELQGVCKDEAVLVLLPDSGDDATGPSFVISQEAYGLRLDQMHWDRLTEIGVFASLPEIMATLRPRVAFCSDLDQPGLVTLH